MLRESVEALVRLLSPFTPHLCEELWEQLGHTKGITAAGWPAYDEAAAREDEIEIPVQVNGKVRDRVTVAADAPDKVIETAALAAAGRAIAHFRQRDRQSNRGARPVGECRGEMSRE